MGNDVPGGKQTITIHPNDGNMYDILEFIEGRNVVWKWFRALIVYGYHLIAVIGELHKYIADQHNWTIENIEVFITIRADGTAMSPIEIFSETIPSAPLGTFDSRSFNSRVYSSCEIITSAHI